MKLNKQRLMEMAGLKTEAASSYVKVTKDMWAKMDDDQQADALLTAMKDPDKAEQFIGSEWESLPSEATSNMHVYGGLNEAAIEGGDLLVLTLKVPLELFRDAAEAMEYDLDPDLEASPNMLKQLAATMEDDLDLWFGNNGGEWLEDGINQNVYDDFLSGME
jgi:hypothetical protein